jgi:hypothetical protein
MAQAAQQGQAGQLGQAGQQMMNQLNDAEALQQLLQQAQAAANACKGQCQGLGQNMAMGQTPGENSGGGMGNRGQGRGGKAPIAPTPSGSRTEMAKIKTVEGDVIAKQLFEGPQIRGESKAKLLNVVAEASKGFEEGLDEEQLPRQYHEAHQHYFGELEKITKAIQADSDAKNSDAPAADSPKSGEGASSSG